MIHSKSRVIRKNFSRKTNTCGIIDKRFFFVFFFYVCVCVCVCVCVIRPAETYINQVLEDTGHRLLDLPIGTNGKGDSKESAPLVCPDDDDSVYLNLHRKQDEKKYLFQRRQIFFLCLDRLTYKS